MKQPWPLLRERLIDQGLEVEIDQQNWRLIASTQELSQGEFEDALRHAEGPRTRKVALPILACFALAFTWLAAPLAQHGQSEAPASIATNPAIDCSDSVIHNLVSAGQEITANSPDEWVSQLETRLAPFIRLMRHSTIVNLGGLSTFDVTLEQADCSAQRVRVEMERAENGWRLNKITRRPTVDG